jgi:hypothetical protein
MIERRRFSLQLTPLLDLLLIVMFAQYMEVRDQDTVRSQGMSEQSQRLAAAEQQLAELQPEVNLLQELRNQIGMHEQAESMLAAQLSESYLENEQLTLQNTILQDDMQRVATQQAVLGELLSRLFQVSPEQVDAVLDPDRERPLSESPSELERIRQEFAAMAEQSPGQTIVHLLTYHEIRKFCDVWELNVDRGFFTLKIGEEVLSRRLAVTADGSLDAEGTQQELFDVMKSVNVPKELVVILVTFDRECLIDTETQIRRLLPDLVAQYRANVPGDKQVHYADFGHGFE